MAARSRADTVVAPPTAKITRLEGKALARTNFMSWAVDVLGSTEAAKRHFLSIREVARQPGMFLTDAAKLRFESARTDFEGAHPGYTFPSTDVAQHLRGFHQARQGIGMLGHALGVAFDLLAYDNPNQKLGETENYGYLLNRFWGTGDTRGRSIMTLGVGGEDTISRLGRDTAAHRSTPAGDAMVERIRTQFDEMAATSERFRTSMEAHLPELSEARDQYFNSKETEKELAQATQDEKNADKIANKRLKDEKFSGGADEKIAQREAIKQELTKRKQRLAEELEAAKASIDTSLEQAFADWISTIRSDIAAAEARKATSDAELAAQAKVRQDLDAIDVLAPAVLDVLDAFADQHHLKTPKQVFGDGKVVPGVSAPAPGAAPAAGTAPAAGAAGPAAAPAPGAGAAAAPSPDARQPAKHWATKMQVTNAPIMQFVEHGFIRHDEMPDRGAGGGAKQVFNAEVAATLARYGFSPGATFRDTMHFDFIEGYSASPGGRSPGNMNRNKYGPSGDVPPPTPKAPAPSAGGKG
jgi:hypothetical protein